MGIRDAKPGENLARWKEKIKHKWYELEQSLQEIEPGKTLLEVRVEGSWNRDTERWNRPGGLCLIFEKTDKSASWIWTSTYSVSWMLTKWRFHDATSDSFSVTREQVLQGVA
jgi:hypothetical protein